MSKLPALQPWDEYNQRLADQVHPAQWTNPQPSGRYNLVVIGAGTAGLVAAAGAAGLGAKVALIERELLGGDCLNVGCVPSKAIIASARVAAKIRTAGEFGIDLPGNAMQVDFAAVMQRMRRLRSEISPHDSAARFRDLGVDVFLGEGRFVDHDTIEVGDQKLKFKRAVIATGARAARLPIDGWDDVSPLSNETLFSLTQLPPRLTVIGGGPIGAEITQAFARLGSQVTLIEKSSHILAREDRDAALIVQQSLQNDGVRLILNAQTQSFVQRDHGKVTRYRQDEAEGEAEVEADQILVSIGRSPNVENLGLEKAGVTFDPQQGVQLNARLQTTNSRIFAAGDVASKYKFTHAADFMARTVIQNALFFGRSQATSLIIPWATYTSPELAHVGLSPAQAAEQGIEVDTYTQELSGVDRAIVESATDGFVKVHVRRGSDRIVGATIVAESAGDLISHLTLAMKQRIGLGAIASTIHPYPTTADAIRKLGDQYNKTRLTPLVKRLFSAWLKWTR